MGERKDIDYRYARETMVKDRVEQKKRERQEGLNSMSEAQIQRHAEKTVERDVQRSMRSRGIQ